MATWSWVATQGSRKCFALRPNVIADARSNTVLVSTKPSVAFEDFNPVELSVADIARAPVRPKLFGKGTRVAKKFKGPISDRGKRLWRTRRRLEAEVVSSQNL